MLASTYTKQNVILAALTLFSALSLLLLFTETRQHVCGLLPYSVPTQLELQQHNRRKLHFLVPVNSKAAQGRAPFCKTIFSAIVHGYEPTVINWDLDAGWDIMQRMKVVGMRCSYV